MSEPISYDSLIQECRNTEQRFVDIERDGAVALVRMNHPKRYNALTPALTWQLQQSLRELVDDHHVQAVILTGADPAFSAGGDLQFIQRAEDAIKRGEQGTMTAWRWIRRQFGGIARLLAQSDTHFIGAVNGSAAGVGLSFAFSCDMLIGSERAELVPAFGKIGLIPEVGSSWHLCRRLGYQRAMEYFVDGQHIDAAKALELGLLNRVVPHETLLEESRAWAEKVCALPVGVGPMAKTQLRKIADMSWEQAIVMEEFAEPNCFTTEDHRSAVRKLAGG